MSTINKSLPLANSPNNFDISVDELANIFHMLKSYINALENGEPREKHKHIFDGILAFIIKATNKAEANAERTIAKALDEYNQDEAIALDELIQDESIIDFNRKCMPILTSVDPLEQAKYEKALDDEKKTHIANINACNKRYHDKMCLAESYKMATIEKAILIKKDVMSIYQGIDEMSGVADLSVFADRLQLELDMIDAINVFMFDPWENTNNVIREYMN
jgi:hypothetical protein